MTLGHHPSDALTHDHAQIGIRRDELFHWPQHARDRKQRVHVGLAQRQADDRGRQGFDLSDRGDKKVLHLDCRNQMRRLIENGHVPPRSPASLRVDRDGSTKPQSCSGNICADRYGRDARPRDGINRVAAHRDDCAVARGQRVSERGQDCIASSDSYHSEYGMQDRRAA